MTICQVVSFCFERITQRLGKFACFLDTEMSLMAANHFSVFKHNGKITTTIAPVRTIFHAIKVSHGTSEKVFIKDLLNIADYIKNKILAIRQPLA